MVNVSMANVTSSSALAPDALNYKAYDGNNSTYVGAYQPNHMSLYPPPEIKSIGGNMMVDESAINKTLNISFSRTGGGSGSSAPNGEIRIYSYDENNSIISTKIINKNQSGIRNETAHPIATYDAILNILIFCLKILYNTVPNMAINTIEKSTIHGLIPWFLIQ